MIAHISLDQHVTARCNITVLSSCPYWALTNIHILQLFNVLRALANNELHSSATPGGNLFAMSARIVSRGAVYVASITIALDLGSVFVEKCKAITPSGEDLYRLSEMLLFWSFKSDNWMNLRHRCWYRCQHQMIDHV